jgi:hypothetical protein
MEAECIQTEIKKPTLFYSMDIKRGMMDYMYNIYVSENDDNVTNYMVQYKKRAIKNRFKKRRCKH